MDRPTICRRWRKGCGILFLGLTLLLACPGTGTAQQNPHGVLPVAGMEDPYLLLIHDPFVHQELKLSAGQRALLSRVCGQLDGDIWTTRNQTAERAAAIRRRLQGQAAGELAEVFTPDQARRLREIERRTIGVRVFLREDMSQLLALRPDQREAIGEILRKTDDASAAIIRKRQAGDSSPELDTQHRELQVQAQKDIWARLTDDQKKKALEALGATFDASKLGNVRLLAPEFPPATAWLNSQPLTLKELRGQVVVVFVWTFGCINCIRNYPWYLGWYKDFGGRDFTIIGVHTPEVEGEHDLMRVTAKTRENGFDFPVVVDNDKKIWNAWGNSMWPSTYVIDRRGFVRAWWLGELNWENQPGEKLLRGRIEELLAE
ncbi:MAG: redoxin domain-containing protein [Pirellulales bacterium]